MFPRSSAKKIWTNGWSITIMAELIWEKSVVEGRHWTHYLMEKRSGLKRI